MAACTTASVIDHQRRLICAVMLSALALGSSLDLSLDLLPAAALPLLFATILPARNLFSTWPNCVTLLRTLLAVLNALWPMGSAAARCACGIAFVALDFVDGASREDARHGVAQASKVRDADEVFGA